MGNILVACFFWLTVYILTRYVCRKLVRLLAARGCWRLKCGADCGTGRRQYIGELQRGIDEPHRHRLRPQSQRQRLPRRQLRARRFSRSASHRPSPRAVAPDSRCLLILPRTSSSYRQSNVFLNFVGQTQGPLLPPSRHIRRHSPPSMPWYLFHFHLKTTHNLPFIAHSL